MTLATENRHFLFLTSEQRTGSRKPVCVLLEKQFDVKNRKPLGVFTPSVLISTSRNSFFWGGWREEP